MAPDLELLQVLDSSMQHRSWQQATCTRVGPHVHASAQMPVASWGTKEGWVKQLGLAQLQSLLRPGVTGAAEEPARIPAAHVSVTVQGPARKDLVTVAGPPQTVRSFGVLDCFCSLFMRQSGHGLHGVHAGHA